MRIRTVKPEFWTDEGLASVSEPACLLAIGLLNMADDEGYFKSNPLLVKAAIFPLREPSKNVLGMLQELSSVGYIELSEGSDGHHYGRVVKFSVHQRVDKPQASKIKGLFGIPRTFQEGSKNIPGAFQVGMEGEGEGEQGMEQGSGKGTICRAGSSTARSLEIESVCTHYQQYHPQARPNAKDRKRIKDRLTDGYTGDDLCTAIDGCHVSPHHCGYNETGTKYQSLELIMRDSKHVQQFIEIARDPPRTTNKAEQRTAGNLRAMETWLQETSNG